MELLLPLLVIFPLLAGVCIGVFGGSVPRYSAVLGVGVAGLVVLLAIAAGFYVSQVATGDGSAAIEASLRWKPSWLEYDFPFLLGGQEVTFPLVLGMDGIGSLMALLTAVITVAVATAAIYQIDKRLNVYVGLLLVTEALLMGVFLAMDVLTFYVCFEAVLLPVILLLTIWGQRGEASWAASRFFLFTLAGSIPMVVGLIGLVINSIDDQSIATTELTKLSIQIPIVDRAIAESPDMMETTGVVNDLDWILATLLLGFGIKMAIVPLHAWLPTTYQAAHPNTTALIAAVVGKLGLFGIVRLVLPLMPFALEDTWRYVFAILGAVAIVYGALAALAQSDPRRLFAYSSISHLGFITIGLMSYDRVGVSGAILQMVNHGLIVAAVYLLIAAMEKRYGRHEVNRLYQGLASTAPGLAAILIFFLLAGAGLPGLNSFVGELMTLAGALKYSLLVAAIAITGLLFGAWYALRFIAQCLFGPANVKPQDKPVLSRWETVPLLSLAALCLVIGVRPMGAIELIDNDVAKIVQRLEVVPVPTTGLAQQTR